MTALRFGFPVEGKVYPIGVAHPAKNFAVTQKFGCTGFGWEPPLGSCPHFNRGLDIARGPAGCGDPALAVQDGTVLYAGGIATPGDGGDHSLAVVISHGGGHATGIGHLKSIAVHQGQKVKIGQRIGAVGQTGLATGCHIDLVYKTGYPAGLTGAAAADALYLDPGKGGKGAFTDIWPRFEQNAPRQTVRPRGPGINIRTKASTASPAYAMTVPNGTIARASDGATIGPTATERAYGGRVTGGTWSTVVNDKPVSGKTWDKMWLDGAYRYIASALTIISD